METLLIILASINILFLGVVIFLLWQRQQKEQASSTLHQRLDHLSSTVISQLNQMTEQLNQRLREGSERLDRTSKIVSSVTERLARLQESSKRIFEVGRDIRHLKDILRGPKFRGGFGEHLLEEILSHQIPKENYELQYRFKSGEKVDAVIKLKDMLIPVDAKFPLENFQKMVKAQDSGVKKKLRQRFLKDVEAHIEKIAQKYILPDEGTSDFALMYIPAENVYYEVLIRDKGSEGILGYARRKRVIPVSPNSFYGYLGAIALGLKGLQIEKGAKEILNNLMRLHDEFLNFSEDFKVLGSHLTHAKGKYDDSARKLDLLGAKFSSLHEAESKKLPELQENKPL